MGVCTFVSPTVALITSRWEKIAVQIRLHCNLKTIYQNHFVVTPIRPFHIAGSQEDFQTRKRRSKEAGKEQN